MATIPPETILILDLATSFSWIQVMTQENPVQTSVFRHLKRVSCTFKCQICITNTSRRGWERQYTQKAMKMWKRQKPQIGDNFILKCRDSYLMETKDCFGRNVSCLDPSECPIGIECLERKIKRIRKDILRKELSSKFETLANIGVAKVRRISSNIRANEKLLTITRWLARAHPQLSHLVAVARRLPVLQASFAQTWITPSRFLRSRGLALVLQGSRSSISPAYSTFSPYLVMFVP